MNIEQKNTRSDLTEVEFCIVGTGLGGLGTAARLKMDGETSFVIFEKATDLGGVWHANKYPNVACDTPIDFYSFKFHPGDKWSVNFAPGHEIHAYIREIADTYDLTPHIKYNTEIISADWQADLGRWLVVAANGARWSCRFLAWAGGIFSQPVIPKVAGIDLFEGEQLHPTNWSDDVDLRGKKVAVIGAGATAIQVVPYVVEHAREVINFVRTPSYVSPRPDIELDPENTDSAEFIDQLNGRRKEWLERYEYFNRGRFPMDEKTVSETEAEWQKHFDKAIQDPKLRDILTPNYRFGCKRPLFSNHYYPAMSDEKMTVVHSGVNAVTSGGVVDQDGEEHKVDFIVWATGYDPAAMLGNLKVTGKDGRDLGEFWGPAPEAYYGTLVKEFPNLFVINGPNITGASATEFITGQLNFLTATLEAMRRSGERIVEVTPDAHDSFNARVQELCATSVLVVGGCVSYYRSGEGGNGKVITHWPGTIGSFHEDILKKGPKGLEFSSANVSVSNQQAADQPS